MTAVHETCLVMVFYGGLHAGRLVELIDDAPDCPCSGAIRCIDAGTFPGALPLHPCAAGETAGL